MLSFVYSMVGGCIGCWAFVLWANYGTKKRRIISKQNAQNAKVASIMRHAVAQEQMGVAVRISPLFDELHQAQACLDMARESGLTGLSLIGRLSADEPSATMEGLANGSEPVLFHALYKETDELEAEEWGKFTPNYTMGGGLSCGTTE